MPNQMSNCVIALLSASFLATGCATKTRTSLLGAAIGAGVGAAISGIHSATSEKTVIIDNKPVTLSPNTGLNLLIASSIGAVVGGGLFFLHDHLKDRHERDLIRGTTDAFLLHQGGSKKTLRGNSNPWIYLNDPRRIEWVEPYFDQDDALHERHRRFFIYTRRKDRSNEDPSPTQERTTKP